MVHRPDVFSAFEFAVLSGLRAAQLMHEHIMMGRDQILASVLAEDVDLVNGDVD